MKGHMYNVHTYLSKFIQKDVKSMKQILEIFHMSLISQLKLIVDFEKDMNFSLFAEIFYWLLFSQKKGRWNFVPTHTHAVLATEEKAFRFTDDSLGSPLHEVSIHA